MQLFVKNFFVKKNLSRRHEREEEKKEGKKTRLGQNKFLALDEAPKEQRCCSVDRERRDRIFYYTIITVHVYCTRFLSFNFCFTQSTVPDREKKNLDTEFVIWSPPSKKRTRTRRLKVKTSKLVQKTWISKFRPQNWLNIFVSKFRS